MYGIHRPNNLKFLSGSTRASWLFYTAEARNWREKERERETSEHEREDSVFCRAAGKGKISFS